jgi:CubicO group peptidase (beta-lactamase class C family)
MRIKLLWLPAALLGAGAILTGITGAARPPAPPAAEPALEAAPRAAPPARPLDRTFASAIARASELPRLRSLLISVDGELVAERYFHGATARRAANIKSASKSLIAILVGIAIDRGQIPDVRQPIGTYFPQYVKNDPAKAAITIEDLLTMRSGLETTSNRNYGRWVMSGNWVRHVLQQPFVDNPGGRMIYSTGTSHLLSAIVTRATGRSTYQFAREQLAAPLGISLAPWVRDPQGIYLGGNEMHMLPRHMVTIGELYLNQGRHADRQVVSETWVRASTTPRTTSRWSGREYGYGWWIRSLGGTTVHYAWGYGGQFIFVVPDTRTVVVTTSASEPNTERREHLDAIYDLLAEEIIHPLRGAGSMTGSPARTAGQVPGSSSTP